MLPINISTGGASKTSLPLFKSSVEDATEIVDEGFSDGVQNWSIIVKKTTDLTFERLPPYVDVFLVGGGGSGSPANSSTWAGGYGGFGGYAETVKNLRIRKANKLTCEVGTGGYCQGSYGMTGSYSRLLSGGEVLASAKGGECGSPYGVEGRNPQDPGYGGRPGYSDLYTSVSSRGTDGIYPFKEESYSKSTNSFLNRKYGAGGGAGGGTSESLSGSGGGMPSNIRPVTINTDGEGYGKDIILWVYDGTMTVVKPTSPTTTYYVVWFGGTLGGNYGGGAGGAGQRDGSPGGSALENSGSGGGGGGGHSGGGHQAGGVGGSGIIIIRNARK